MTSNRLQLYWDSLLPHFQKKWPEVPDSKWEDTITTFDDLVRVVRNATAAGRSGIICESEVRDFANQLIDTIEWDRTVRACQS